MYTRRNESPGYRVTVVQCLGAGRVGGGFNQGSRQFYSPKSNITWSKLHEQQKNKSRLWRVFLPFRICYRQVYTYVPLFPIRNTSPTYLVLLKQYVAKNVRNYIRTPLIRTLVIRMANYPDRLGPSGKFAENSTKLTYLEITVDRINLSRVLWLQEL